MAEFKPVRRSWQTSADDSNINCYLMVDGRFTLPELADYFSEHFPGVDLWHQVTLTFGTACWEDAPNEQERAARQEHRARQAERHEAWERETYSRLKAKFETALTDSPTEVRDG